MDEIPSTVSGAALAPAAGTDELGVDVVSRLVADIGAERPAVEPDPAEEAHLPSTFRLVARVYARGGRFPAAPHVLVVELGVGIAIVDDPQMLFMIIEHFEGGDPGPVYRRFRERGRLTLEGLDYVASWVTSDLTQCYQVMECAERAQLDEWMAQWADLVRFEVVEVMTSASAAAAVAVDTGRA